MTFPYSTTNNHILFNSGDRTILLDTGSPVTIGKNTAFDFMGSTHTIPTHLMGTTIEQIISLAGHDFDVLLGTDLLRQFVLEINPETCTLSFHAADSRFEENEGINLTLESPMGIPLLYVAHENRRGKFYLDSGARISYISHEWTNHLESLGIEPDFHPSIGRFDTPVFETTILLGENINIPVRAGNLPAAIDRRFMTGGIKGILGMDLFNHHRVIIDLKQNSLIISP